MRTYLICRKKVEIVWWVSDDVSFTRRIERAGGITEPEKASESMTYESWVLGASEKGCACPSKCTSEPSSNPKVLCVHCMCPG